MVQSINRSRAPKEVLQQIDLAKAIADQEQAVATGKRFTKPSQDPQAWLEISSLSRFQTDEAAWTSNIGRAETRASQAEASFNAMSSGITRARELLVLASNGTLTDADRAGLAIELEGIAKDIQDLAGQRDSFGGPLFSAGPAIAVPIGNNRQVVAAPNLQTVTENVDIGGGATASLDDIMTAVVAAVKTGTAADRAAQLPALDGALDHVTGLLTKQGVARNTLEQTSDQLAQNKVSLAERRSQLEDVDVTQAISQSKALLTNLQAAQAVYAKVSENILLDYLR